MVESIKQDVTILRRVNKDLELLTQDALRFQATRSVGWLVGWKEYESKLRIVWQSLHSVSNACIELTRYILTVK